MNIDLEVFTSHLCQIRVVISFRQELFIHVLHFDYAVSGCGIEGKEQTCLRLVW